MHLCVRTMFMTVTLALAVGIWSSGAQAQKFDYGNLRWGMTSKEVNLSGCLLMAESGRLSQRLQCPVLELERTFQRYRSH